MNLENLRDNYPKLISYMKTNGYSKMYVDRFKREIKKILMAATSNKWSCYRDVYLDYTKTSSSSDYLRNKRTIIGAIEQFDVFGSYPDGGHRQKLFSRDAYGLLSEEFKSLIDYYCEAEKKNGKKDSTIYTQSNNASTFFLSLQQKGINSLEKITEKAVLLVFVSPDGTLLRSCSYKKNIAQVIKAAIPYHPQACHRVLAFLPALREIRKNIQYLSPEEIQKVKDVLADGKSKLTFRDKAIGMLALYTGLRGCDITALTLDSINWEKDFIRLRQQKTDFFLELPLTALVGNAIYDYLREERPRTESRYIFISQNKPCRQLKGRSMSNVSVKIFKAAGIRQLKGERKGLHIFRHHFATALLGNGVSRPVISRTLGHSSPNSLEPYLSADFAHLKECSISIEHFAVPQEVFPHE